MNRDPISILLVEDSEPDALLTRKILSRSSTPFAVEWAASYRAALEILTTTAFDAVLIDLHLDEFDGIQLIRAAWQAGCKSPMIVLTGESDINVEVESIHAGAADYLVKSQFDSILIERVVRHAIERQRTRLALSEERQRLQTLLDNLPDVIYFKDRSSRFILCNASLLRLLGVDTLEQALGKTDSDFFPAALAAQYREDEQRIVETGQALINKEETVVDPSGRIRWILTSKVPLLGPDNSVNGLVGLGRDITALKQAEDELRQAHDELEERVKERTLALSEAVTALQTEVSSRQQAEEQLREAIVRLEKHSKAKSEFVANVSHELKTPLTSMMYGTRNLLRGIAGPLPDKAVHYLRMFDTECQRLVGTINDILDFGKLDNQSLTLSPVTVPLGHLITRSVDSLRIQAESAQLDLNICIEPGTDFVKCDPDMIHRVIQNLLSNAIKFTPAKGRIILRAEPAPDGSKLALISVTDTGIGIPSEAIPHIAKRYFRVASHATGSGLGLAISKEILLLHGGNLSVISPPPGQTCGTRVMIGIPLAEPPTILVLEPDPEAQTSLGRQLREHGYRVESDVRGDSALTRVGAGHLDLVVMDLVLEDMEGLDVILTLKQSPTFRYVPVVAVTSSTLDETTTDVLTRFAIPTLPKPWKPRDLIETVERALLSKTVFQVPKQEMKT
jgi:PAS domain S-box-containing protein